MSNDILLVVGNGMDYGLGYDTSYLNLYKFLKYNRRRRIRRKFNYVNNRNIFKKKYELWKDFEKIYH